METMVSADQKRNLGLNCLHEASWGFGIAFHNSYAVIPLFLSLLNAPDGVVISVAGLFSILIAIPQLVSAVMGRNIRNIRFAVLGVHTLVWPPIFVAGFTFAFFAPTGPSAWIFYYICFLLYGLAIGMIIPIWADFLKHVTRAESRGTFFGISFAFNSLGGVIGGLLSRQLLANFSFPGNFGWGFLITFASLVTGTLIFLLYKIKEPAEIQPHKTIRQFWEQTRSIVKNHKNFRRYIFSRIFFTANFPAMSLYVIYAKDRFGFDISEAGMFTAVNAVAFGIASYLAGRFGDRYGHKSALTISLGLHLIALIIALAARNMWWVYAIFLFLGAGQGSFFPSSMSLVYAFAGRRDNKTYMALIDTSLAPFTFASIMIAGSLIHVIDVAFILQGIGILIAVSIGLMLITVREPKHITG
ncbi:MAG: MFS transporter [Candidatus Marinimicrobia bacterium]|nr:MFS transporter [Candidatus Neomarinimicrobiota bacterium]